MRIGRFSLIAGSALFLATSCAHRHKIQISSELSPGLPPFLPGQKYSLSYIRLGEGLFFDSALSDDGRHSCASCHKLGKALSGRSFKKAGCASPERDVPPLVNLYARSSAMWDGRVPLDEQPHLPLTSPCELSINWKTALLRIQSRAYVKEFTYRQNYRELSQEEVEQSLAVFVRSIISSKSKFDDYFYLQKDDALSRKQVLGLKLFMGKAGCSQCHTISGSFALFTDDGFHAVNLSGKGSDTGRYRFTHDDADKFLFRTPTLRGIGLTSPYFHDGSARSLSKVVHLYNLGINQTGKPLDRKLSPLRLNQTEERSLVSFLRALDSKLKLYVPKP